MELEIVPEPPPEEREAIAAALERLLAVQDRRDGAAPAWWRAGLPDDSDGHDALTFEP